MATLLLGTAKGLGGLMGMAALMFGLAIKRVEVQIEEMQLDAVEDADVAPPEVKVVPADLGE